VKKVLAVVVLSVVSTASFATCKTDRYGNFVCDYGGNLGGGGYSHGTINGKKYNSYGYGNGKSTEIEFDNGQKVDCYRYGNNTYSCQNK